jgi:hypothetical protein
MGSVPIGTTPRFCLLTHNADWLICTGSSSSTRLPSITIKICRHDLSVWEDVLYTQVIAISYATLRVRSVDISGEHLRNSFYSRCVISL